MDETLAREKAALRRAAEILGGQAALATICGYPDRRHVFRYFNTDTRFPAEKCPVVERATRAKNQVVTCEELRSDVAWEVLREQAA